MTLSQQEDRMKQRTFAHSWGPVLGVLALMLVATAVQAQPAKKREVAGVVADVEGKPISGATVAVTPGGPTATTGADGGFKLTVPATAIVVEVTADGFTARQVAVAAATTALQLELVLVRPPPVAPPPTRMVGGVVTDPGHAPIAGATVRVHGTELTAVTGEDGVFSLAGVAVGEVVLDVEAPGQPPASATLPADRAAATITVGAPKPVVVAPTTRAIRGKVLEPSTREPIAGAQVQVVGSQAIAFTEADGAFVLEGQPLGAVELEIAAPEHEPKTVPVAADQASVEVTVVPLKGETIEIEGRAPAIVKANLANGASVIDAKDLNRVSAQTIDAAMNGKLAGANLQSNSGAPGGGAQLRLRGISTINGQSSPLYVIDGVVVSNVAIPSGANLITAAAAGGSTSNQDNPVNRIADLNPNDIENIEVLKGASAAALYGSKAANGVVVITTKRGRNGENHATVTQRFGISQVAKTLGARTFTSVDDVKAAFGDTSPLVQAYLDANGKTYDHEAELTRTAFARETIGTVSGGSDNATYFGSVLLRDDPGVVIGTYYEKQSGRVAVGYKFGDRVRLGMTANIVHSTSDRGLTNNDNTGTSNYVVLSSTPNFVNLQPKDGVYPANPAVGSSANPIQTVNLLQNREDVWRLITGGTLAVDAFASDDGSSRVKLLGNFGVDSFTQKNQLLSPNQLLFEPADGLTGTSIDASSTNLNWNAGAGATWSYRPPSGAFRSALSGGVTYESVDLNSVYVFAQNLNAGQPNVNSATSINTTQARLRTKDSGLYLQEELALLDEQLQVLGGLLGERSSLNGDTTQYHAYPKLAALYSLIRPGKAGVEPLVPGLETLRLRGAYGEAGNRPNYGQKFTPLTATGNIDGNPGLTIAGTLGAPNIEPERQREFELGVDLSAKDQRVVAELTAYQRSISNLLLQRTEAQTVGFTTQFLNGGGLRNRGLEMAVSVRPPVGALVDWLSRATLTLNRSEITDLPAAVPTFDITAAGFGTGLGAYRIEAGKSATQIVATIDKMGTVAVVGNGEPDFRVGWSNVVNVGDFSFSALIDWQHGSNVINLTRLLYDASSNSPDAAAATARLTAFGGKDARPYIEDASFVKVREISVAYSLPKKIAAQLGPLKTLDVSLSGRNLLTFTGYSGLDPEVSNFGGQSIGRNYDVAPYPPSRSFWLSITAGL
jgi:TonB-dependent starch-binding outer membrane protein SusC